MTQSHSDPMTPPEPSTQTLNALRDALQKISDTALSHPYAGVTCGEMARKALQSFPQCVAGMGDPPHDCYAPECPCAPQAEPSTSEDEKEVRDTLAFYSGREDVGILKRHGVTKAKEASKTFNRLMDDKYAPTNLPNIKDFETVEARIINADFDHAEMNAAVSSFERIRLDAGAYEVLLDSCREQIQELHEKISTVRNEALEEAAMIAGGFDFGESMAGILIETHVFDILAKRDLQIATVIRALKTPQSSAVRKK